MFQRVETLNSYGNTFIDSPSPTSFPGTLQLLIEAKGTEIHVGSQGSIVQSSLVLGRIVSRVTHVMKNLAQGFLLSLFLLFVSLIRLTINENITRELKPPMCGK